MKKKIILPHSGMSARRTGFSSFPVVSAADELVKVSAADTTAKYLGAKVGFGAGMSGATLNPGGDEVLVFTNTSLNTDVKSKVSAADTTSNYLNSKITVGAGLSKAIVNPGANETLNLVNTAVAKKRYTLNFGYGGSIAVNSFYRAVAGAATFPTVTNGYYINKACKIIDWGILLSRYLTFDAVSYTRVQLKSTTANALRAADITIATGFNHVNFDVVFPNSGGAFGYYFGGGQSGTAYALNAGDMVFVCCCAQTANSVTGGSVWLLIEED